MKNSKSGSFYNVFVKRLLDIVFSLLAIIIFFPLLFFVFIINCIFTKFHPIFIQKRCGRNAKEFLIIKFRTLLLNSPSYEEKCNGNNYTKIGFFLRKTHLDELPQLFNIFAGQMSFVGPRPIITILNDQIDGRIANGSIALRPGLSGLAQLNESNKELSRKEKCEFDKIYLDNMSFILDLKIVVLTIPHIVKNTFRKKH